jgi:hypothetical protein
VAFSELELKRYHKTMQQYIDVRRPPPHIRNQLDLSYRIERQSVEVFAIRPAYKNLGSFIEEPVAKVTYVKRAKEWRVYWQRADLNWHRYEPKPCVRSLNEFISLIEEDEYCCFYG